HAVDVAAGGAAHRLVRVGAEDVAGRRAGLVGRPVDPDAAEGRTPAAVARVIADHCAVVCRGAEAAAGTGRHARRVGDGHRVVVGVAGPQPADGERAATVVARGAGARDLHRAPGRGAAAVSG